MKILKQNEDQEQQGKFRNYSEIFARIAKFSLCAEISLHREFSLHSEKSLCSKKLYGGLRILSSEVKKNYYYYYFILFYKKNLSLKKNCFLIIFLFY